MQQESCDSKHQNSQSTYTKINYWEDAAAIGTEYYHKVWENLYCTDGVFYMSGQLACTWLLIDIALLFIPKVVEVQDTFAVIRLHLNADISSAEILLDDGNGNVYFKYTVPFTDLKYNIKLFIACQGYDWIVMLPSEY